MAAALPRVPPAGRGRSAAARAGLGGSSQWAAARACPRPLPTPSLWGPALGPALPLGCVRASHWWRRGCRGAVIGRAAGRGAAGGGDWPCGGAGRPAGCGGGGGGSRAVCRRLSGAGLWEVLGRAQGLLFDCDGVLWAGERAVPGAPELLERLRRSGKAALFVSNNSRRSVAELERRFSRLGFRGVRAEHVFSSALCSALFLRQRLLGGGGNGSGAGRVFVLGGEGLRGEVRDAGLRLAGEGEPAPGEPVRAVLVGYDDQFTFAKLAQACGYLRDPQCLLVATDPDPWHPLSDGQRTPGEPAPRPGGRGCWRGGLGWGSLSE
ncbi:hypothetical protein DV515_00009121 [Chloebia gouldiae]|uniref:Uncharacterized protein n=1 Tax=Chloebia gouldiae TaxID=44316 RepID=A0A3L8SCV7_CHLGU|nr:hypothetical protein DV515_00009121 [Chloebia gouldiae]